MSKNSNPPRPAPFALPDRLRNDGWWLTDGSQNAPAAARSDTRLIVISTRPLQESSNGYSRYFDRADADQTRRWPSRGPACAGGACGFSDLWPGAGDKPLPFCARRLRRHSVFGQEEASVSDGGFPARFFGPGVGAPCGNSLAHGPCPLFRRTDVDCSRQRQADASPPYRSASGVLPLRSRHSLAAWREYPEISCDAGQTVFFCCDPTRRWPLDHAGHSRSDLRISLFADVVRLDALLQSGCGNWRRRKRL